MGVILCAHPVRGESHIQRNANQEVATIPQNLRYRLLEQKKAKDTKNYGPIPGWPTFCMSYTM